MKSSGVHVVRRRLADGSVKEYRYDRNKPKAERLAAGSLGALIVSYKTSPEWRKLAPYTIGQYTLYLRDLESIHHVSAAAMRRRDIIRIRNLIAGSRGNGAAQAFVRAAQALFTWAIEADLLETSPAAKIEALPRGELRAWTAAEADYAEANLAEEYRRVVVLGRHTGQRRSDLCAMTWKAYDGRSIIVKQQKTGVELTIPCSRPLIRELNAWKKGATSTHILTSKRGLPWQPQHLSMKLPAALARIGMPKGMNTHGLRKLAAASLAEAGCSVSEIMSITGHKTMAMVQHYTKSASQKRLAASAVERLETDDVKRRKTRG